MFNMESYHAARRAARHGARSCDTTEYAKWKGFRASEDSRYVALTLPRILIREPYGSGHRAGRGVRLRRARRRHRPLASTAGPTRRGRSRARVTQAFATYGWCATIRGVESGGLVDGLPVHNFKTESGDIAMKCPTETPISDRREKELADLGFAPLVHCKGTDYAAFFSVQSAQKPKIYDSDAATANARISAQLPYIFAVSRFAHYLKSIMRDKIGGFASRDEIADVPEQLDHQVRGRQRRRRLLDEGEPSAEGSARRGRRSRRASPARIAPSRSSARTSSSTSCRCRCASSPTCRRRPADSHRDAVTRDANVIFASRVTRNTARPRLARVVLHPRYHEAPHRTTIYCHHSTETRPWQSTCSSRSTASRASRSTQTHKGEIDVLAWSWGATQSGSTHIGGGGGAGKVNVQDISFTKYIDKAIADAASCTARPASTSRTRLLIVRKAGGTPLEYLKIKLDGHSRQLVLRRAARAAKIGSTENVSLNFAKIELDVHAAEARRHAASRPRSSGCDIPANAADVIIDARVVMNARQLFQAGRLDEAIEALGAEVRDNPTDAQRRAFLFELLCFAGQYDRAEKQLNVLGSGGRDAEMGALLYHAALHAERLRQDMFDKQTFPVTLGAASSAARSTGSRSTSITDADPRIGPRLEVFAAGQYMWLPFEHIETVRVEAPKRLRDLLWAPAIVRPAETFKGLEMGEALLPAIAPLTWRHADGAVRLGRVTEWTQLDGRRPGAGRPEDAARRR